jgi:multiple sugar transport system permease protein
MKGLLQRRSISSASPVGMALSYLALGAWTFVVLFPLYWLVVTSLKLPIQVAQGPFYIPFVDFQPSLDAWHYILAGDLSRDTLRTYANTVVVAPTSALLALLFRTAAAYGLTRFEYQPRLGAVVSFIGCVALCVVAVVLGVHWQVAIAAGLAIFVIIVLTLGRRFKRSLGNEDIAFWMISQRMLPPVAVVIPIYIDWLPSLRLHQLRK